MSDRLRLDLVLNDFVAGALTSGEITVLSDGTPWRPLIDVKDMSRAIDWALDRFLELDIPFISVNAGNQEWNYQVKDLAYTVADIIPGTKVSINTNSINRHFKKSNVNSKYVRGNYNPTSNALILRYYSN